MKSSRPIAISLSPNTEPEDIKLALRLLFRKSLWKKEHIRSITEKMKQYFSGREVVLTSSGRQALYDLLRAHEIGEGDEVIVQAFTCIAVPAPIIWTGASPVYADILKETYNLDPADVEKKITPRTKAIIVQHTFGITGPIKELREIADKHGILLFEDCAHGLGNSYEGTPLGALADGAILSFGRDKMISTVFGGAVVTPNLEISQRLRTYQNERSLPPTLWVYQQLLHPLLMAISLPLYFSGLGKVLLVAAQKLNMLSKAVQQAERGGERPDHLAYSYSPALALLLRVQWQKLARFTDRRRAINAKYDQAFDTRRAAGLLRFPFVVKNPADVLSQAREHRMLLGDWYDGPLSPSRCSLSFFKYERGSCKQAEEASRNTINLPTYPLLTDQQVEEVITFITKHQ